VTSDETLNVNDIVETVNHFRCIDLIIDFHVRFEKIHPFQDGNGRVGRLVMFKECLRSGVVPFIITDELKMFYYRGLREWSHIDGYLTDTCLTAQDQYKAALDYFRIAYDYSYARYQRDARIRGSIARTKGRRPKGKASSSSKMARC
jgi:Fic family protein